MRGVLFSVACLTFTAALAAAEPLAPSAAGAKPIEAVIVTGVDWPGHVWKETAPALKGILEKDGRLHVDIAETPEFLASDKVFQYDVIILHFKNYEPFAEEEKARQNLAKFVGDGKGLVVVHYASGAFENWPEYRNLVGRTQNKKHDQRGPFTVKIINHEHPVTRGMEDFQTDDELFIELAGERPIEVLAVARSQITGQDHPLAFVFLYGKGRVFHTTLGHDAKALAMPGTAELLRRGAAWAAQRQQPGSGSKGTEGPPPEKPAKQKIYDKDAGPRPDLEDVPYGSQERLKLDLWKAKADKPRPILVFFHGGGGDKLMFRGNRLLAFCLGNGISAAAVNYRPNNQVPFPVPMQDAARAIQFLRYKAKEFNIDAQRMAAWGTSLGANVSIWLAYHDDIANPKSDDPILRESSRLCFVISSAGQTFNDLELFRQRVYPYPLPAMSETGAEGGRSREKAREISAIYHVTKDDPPILMTYGFPLKELPLPKDTPRGELIHNPAFGLLLKEKLDALGIENYLYHGGNRPPADAQEKFILKHFFGESKP